MRPAHGHTTLCDIYALPDSVAAPTAAFHAPKHQEQLKKSGLGRMVMFLSKLPDELPANRRMARDLVEKWSRPIFEQYRNDQCAAHWLCCA